jgi:hypothetical protein
MHSDDRTECDKDRMALAMADNERYFRDILEEAKRANVSFYTVDPRGLATSDDPGGLDPSIPAALDRRNLTSRSNSLMTLAHNTDGLALVNNNDLRAQLRRVADDLTSYYLMGYYSTNGKLDGRYRSIKVRSKRPGVESVPGVDTARQAPRRSSGRVPRQQRRYLRIVPRSRARWGPSRAMHGRRGARR